MIRCSSCGWEDSHGVVSLGESVTGYHNCATHLKDVHRVALSDIRSSRRSEMLRLLLLVQWEGVRYEKLCKLFGLCNSDGEDD